MKVKVEKPDSTRLEQLQVKRWPIWEKEESRFDWFYDQKEVCYFLEGKVEVELPDGTKVNIGKGDLASFPKGLQCTWHVLKKVKKHYNFEE
jgi:uncharacterized cupin superfamily protein